MPLPNRSWACCTTEATCSGLVTSRAAGSTRCGAVSARSATFATSRAVTTALWPAPMTASASARPSPVEQPVISQVDMRDVSNLLWRPVFQCRVVARFWRAVQAQQLDVRCGPSRLSHATPGPPAARPSVVAPLAPWRWESDPRARTILTAPGHPRSTACRHRELH